MEFSAENKRVAKLQLQEEFSGEFITDRKEIKKIESDTSTDWQSELDKDKTGNVKAHLANIQLILKNDPRLQAIKYDLFASILE